MFNISQIDLFVIMGIVTFLIALCIILPSYFSIDYKGELKSKSKLTPEYLVKKKKYEGLLKE